MSQALERLSGIRKLPIFPLPLVLLPNELLSLHIFEEKYRQMLRDVDLEGSFFGITLFEPQEQFVERPTVGTIGCVAEIRESEMLEDGRSNIVILGLARFRLVEYMETGDPYLVADIDFFEDDAGDADTIAPLAEEVFTLFQRMAVAAFKMSGGRGRLPEIQNTDAEALSFLICAAFNFENEKKYSLIEMASTEERLNELREILNRAVGQIEQSADIQSASRTNGHSKKKLDL
ncbi:MAG: LON peptidase substrate-binding domain-containing protein [Pyrinomonadaceae bacterium]